MPDAVLPTPQEDDGLVAQQRRQPQSSRVAGLEEGHREIANARAFRCVPVTRLNLRPKDLIQPTPPNQSKLVVLPRCQLREQRFENRLQQRLRTRADSEHDPLESFRRFIALEQALEHLGPCFRFEEDAVQLDRRGEVRREAEFAHQDRRLTRPENPLGQLNIQEPVVEILRLRSMEVEKELLIRLLSKHEMLHLKLILVHLPLRDPFQSNRIVVAPKLALRVVPEDDPMLFKHSGQGLFDLCHAVA